MAMNATAAMPKPATRASAFTITRTRPDKPRCASWEQTGSCAEGDRCLSHHGPAKAIEPSNVVRIARLFVHHRRLSLRDQTDEEDDSDEDDYANDDDDEDDDDGEDEEADKKNANVNFDRKNPAYKKELRAAGYDLDARAAVVRKYGGPEAEQRRVRFNTLKNRKRKGLSPVPRAKRPAKKKRAAPEEVWADSFSGVCPTIDGHHVSYVRSEFLMMAAAREHVIPSYIQLTRKCVVKDVRARVEGCQCVMPFVQDPKANTIVFDASKNEWNSLMRAVARHQQPVSMNSEDMQAARALVAPQFQSAVVSIIATPPPTAATPTTAAMSAAVLAALKNAPAASVVAPTVAVNKPNEQAAAKKAADEQAAAAKKAADEQAAAAKKAADEQAVVAKKAADEQTAAVAKKAADEAAAPITPSMVTENTLPDRIAEIEEVHAQLIKAVKSHQVAAAKTWESRFGNEINTAYALSLENGRIVLSESGVTLIRQLFDALLLHRAWGPLNTKARRTEIVTAVRKCLEALPRDDGGAVTLMNDTLDNYLMTGECNSTVLVSALTRVPEQILRAASRIVALDGEMAAAVATAERFIKVKSMMNE